MIAKLDLRRRLRLLRIMKFATRNGPVNLLWNSSRLKRGIEKAFLWFSKEFHSQPEKDRR